MARIRFASVGLLSLLAACGGGGGEGGGAAPTPAAVNAAPTANAGSAATANKGAVVTLDGSASTDPEGAALAYRWTQTSGTAVTLSSTTAAKPTFTAPSVAGALGFSLVVSDGAKDSEAKTVTVDVVDRAPKAQVVAEQAATAGAPVMLDASASADPDGDALVYTWQQTSGPAVTITVDASGRIQFTAPAGATTLTFKVSISDGTNPAVTAIITVQVAPGAPVNRSPVVLAGSDRTVGRNQVVQLFGQGYDPDANPLTFRWEQIAGPSVTLSNARTPFLSFTTPAQLATLRFRLTVSDGVASSSDDIVVEVVNFAPVFYGSAITPASPRTADPLEFVGTVHDPDGDPLTISYEWSRNGAVVAGQATSTYPASLTTRGDVIKVRVTARDATEQATAEATTTIDDTPAVITATPPTSVQYGNSLSFQLSATDADGDPLPAYELAHGPAGFAVSAGGLVTWTAKGVMFDRQQDVNWGVRLHDQPGSLLSGTITVTDATRAQPLRRTSLLTPLRPSGMVVTDLDADGVAEVLIHSGVAAYELGRTSGGYRQRWVYPFAVRVGNSTATGQAVAAADVSGSSAQEIFIGDSGVLVRLDGATRREAARWVSDAGWTCIGLAVADLDGDGAKEVVCLELNSTGYNGPVRLRLLDALTLQPFWTTASGSYGTSIAVGNVDNDAALEIVTSGGYVYDGATRANEWASSAAFGDVVAIGDVDGDGVGEILGGRGATVPVYAAQVVAWNARTHAQLWSFDAPNTGCCGVRSIAAADLNADGRADILIGADQWSGTSAITYDTTAHAPASLWYQANTIWGSPAIGAGDVDGDGKIEAVWANGGDSGRDEFVIAGMNPGLQIEWRSGSIPQLDGPFVGGSLAQLAPGRRELVFASQRTNSGYSGLRALAMDVTTGDFTISPEFGSPWYLAGGVDTADVDQDGVDEVLLSSADSMNVQFRTLDLLAGTTEWQSAPSIGLAQPVTHADCNADGRPELVALTTGAIIVALDPVAQTEVERATHDTNTNGIDIVARSGAALGKCELVVASTRLLAIYRYGAGGLQRVASRTLTADIKDLAVGDLDGDGNREVVVMTGGNYYAGGAVTTYDSQLEPVGSFPFSGSASGISIEEGTGSRRNVLLAEDDKLISYYSANAVVRLRSIDPWTGAEVWRSPPLDGALGFNALHFVDTDGDGELELSLGTTTGVLLTR